MRDYMLKKTMAAAARAEVPCPGCGHPDGDHRGLPRESIALVGGEIVRTPNPDYRPLAFHCDVEGCSCVRNLA